jgi:outer membrane protein TolC
MAVPASRRRGDIGVLIAQQDLNIAVTQQLHNARVAFYTALYQRQMRGLGSTQRTRLDENSAAEKDRYESGVTDRGAFVGAELQARELDPRIDAAERAYPGAVVKLSEAIGRDYGQYTTMPEPEGELHYADVQLGKIETAQDQLASRPDVQLARLLVRSAAEDQRIMEAAYYPQVTGAITGTYIPVTSVRQTQTTGSSRRADDVISSEMRMGGAYTWRVIDNGKVGGAVAQKRAAREINELLLHKLEADASRELARIRNDLDAVATQEKALRGASIAAEENSATVQQNLHAGIASQLEYRLAQNDLLSVQTALATLAYRQQVDLAELDRATGRYLRFVDAGPRDVR